MNPPSDSSGDAPSTSGWKRPWRSRRWRWAVFLALVLPVGAGFGVAAIRDDFVEKRVAVIDPGHLVRGAWQRPGPLRRIIDREKIRTIVTLTAINRDDPKFVGQEKVARETGVDWVIVPMRGSRATLEQMADAADLLADAQRQPVFFHCVAGHHRTSLVHAAYRIRHQGWSADRAWDEVMSLPWARPQADLDDRRLIEAFAASQAGRAEHLSRRDLDDASTPAAEMDPPADPGDRPRREPVHGGPLRDVELRDRGDRPYLPLGPDVGRHPRQDHTRARDQDRPEPPRL